MDRQNKENWVKEAAALFLKIREQRPLVHMIPNAVTAPLCAAALAAAGARPLMASAHEEMREIVSYADALVVNLGQPSREKLAASREALEAAEARKVPVVLDPVGMGASQYRKAAYEALLHKNWSGIIKGNEAELHTLLSGEITHEGIDSVREHQALKQRAVNVQQSWKKEGKSRLLVKTGKQDEIFRGENGAVLLLHPGQLPYELVGTGCMTGALMGACFAVGKMSAETAAGAALLAVSCVLHRVDGFGGYGQFQSSILDGLCRIRAEELWEYGIKNVRIEV